MPTSATAGGPELSQEWDKKPPRRKKTTFRGIKHSREPSSLSRVAEEGYAGLEKRMNRTLLEDIVDKNYGNLFRFALSLTKNEAEASDLTQQTFLLLASKGSQIRDLSKAKSWLFTSLRREFYALRRQNGRYASIEPDDHEFPLTEIEAPENVEFEVLKNADARMIMESLNEISEVFRVPLALFYFEDFSYREIARILQIPEGTVMSRLSRGRIELRTCLLNRVDSDSLPDNILPIDATRKNG